MFKRIKDYISSKFNTSHTNSAFQEDLKDESAYVEKDFDTVFLTKEEAKKLKIKMLEDGIDLQEIFKDSKLFNPNNNFNKNADDYVEKQVEAFEKPLLKNKELTEKLNNNEKLSDNENSFKRAK